MSAARTDAAPDAGRGRRFGASGDAAPRQAPPAAPPAAATPTPAPTADSRADVLDFVPREHVPADSAVSFPVDI